jgi:hypothetical protein
VGLGKRLGQTLITTRASKGLLGAPRHMDVVEGSTPRPSDRGRHRRATRRLNEGLHVITANHSCYLAFKMRR